jgi:RNA polymerase sigma-70 factor (ECF subfamily)
MEKLTDEELMKLLCRGETRALDELYERYAGRLLAFCSSVYRRPGACEHDDLVQDVFLKVVRSARTFDPGKASFRTWLYTIARNRCTDAARRDATVRTIPMSAGAGEDGPGSRGPRAEEIEDPGQDPEASAIRASVVEAVQDCIDRLESDEERQAIALYYLGGNVLREVGAVLGKSTSSAKNLVDSAKAKVKLCLEKKGVRRAAQ